MPIEITVPRLGWSMEEGTFSEWLKRDGEQITKGEPIFVLEGEKASQDIEALDEGILRLLPDGPNCGDTVKVGAVIAVLLSADEVPTWSPSQTNSAVSAGSSEEKKKPAAKEALPKTPTLPQVVTARPKSSPRARRAAAELGVDWKRLEGTGRNGRIRERDVRAAAPSTRKPSKKLRRTIAERMAESTRTTAPVTLTTKADATNLMSLRAQFKATTEEKNAIPSVTDIIVKLVGTALERHPEMNARWQDGDVISSSDVHIGLAVDTDNGLIVPVIRDVPQLALAEVTARSRSLIEKARSGKLAIADLDGATFTVTNLGMFGIDAFTPIINLPEAGILGVGAVRREPVVFEDDRIVARDVTTLSLTFDHRVIDGAPAARFLQTVRSAIENPAAWLID